MMMGRRVQGRLTISLVSTLVMLLSLSACDLVHDDTLKLRIQVVSEYLSPPEVVVHLENIHGTSVNGALVTVTTPGNVSYLVEWDADSASYRRILDYRISGDYLVNVKSTLLKEPKVQSIYHHIVNDGPTITDITDEEGNSTENGEALNAGQGIVVSFFHEDPELIYVITLLKAGTIVYRQTSTVPFCLVPAGVLPSDSRITVSLKALFMTGDPLLEEANYLSYSSQDSAPYVFSTL